MVLRINYDLAFPFFHFHRVELKTSVVLQAAFLFFAAILLDGGDSLRIVSIFAIAYWLAVAIILIRRNTFSTRFDRFLISYGFLLLIAGPIFLIFLIMAIASLLHIHNF